MCIRRLLPAFGAMTDKNVHAAVLAAGVAETGCTIHQVTEVVDGWADRVAEALRCAAGRYGGRL